MEPNWEYRLLNAIDDVTADLGVTKGAFAQALGLNRTLSPSTLSGPHAGAVHARICAALHAANIPKVATLLHIPASAYPRLEAFFRDAVKYTLQYDINPGASRGNFRETIDFGMIGVELVDLGRWAEAMPYLETSWNALHNNPSTDARLDVLAKLRVGTQIMAVDGHWGQTGRTQRIVHELIETTRKELQNKNPSNELVRACAQFYVGAGIYVRLQGTQPPLNAATYSKAALEALEERGLDVVGQIAALRDQAKPLIHQTLLQGSDPRGLVAEALTALYRADTLAGDSAPIGELRDAWLFTRGTMVECLALLGRADEAEKIWDTTMGPSWVDRHIVEKHDTPLKSKLEVAHIALHASKKDLDGVYNLCSAFLDDKTTTRYSDRRRKVALIAQYAETGEIRLLHTSVLG